MHHPGQKEVEAINVVTSQLMGAISFEEGSQPNISKIKDLFVPGGLLINCNESKAKVLTVDAFIAHFQALHQQEQMTGLYEIEVHHKTKVYDHIAHRFSFYEARVSKDTDPFAVGINTIQLTKMAGDWKISTMAWNDDARGDGFFERTMACIREEDKKRS